MIFAWVVVLLIKLIIYFFMMKPTEKNFFDITLALAGIFQAAVMVRDLAKTGTTDETAFNTSINSIYKIDAANTLEIFAGAENLRTGLNALIQLLSNDKATNDIYISRYVISLLHIERKLIKDQTLLNTLTRRINHAISQANYFSTTHPTVISSLADIYINTLGKLPFRLHVLGQAKYLNQPDIMNKVRAVLLAGVRAAVLWRQVGGTRLQLFFCRNKLSRTAKQILNSIENTA
jgi:high frequency lysogenization protein